MNKIQCFPVPAERPHSWSLHFQKVPTPQQFQVKLMMYTTITYFGPGVAAVDLHLLNSERNDLLVEDILPLKINAIER